MCLLNQTVDKADGKKAIFIAVNVANFRRNNYFIDLVDPWGSAVLVFVKLQQWLTAAIFLAACGKR